MNVVGASVSEAFYAAHETRDIVLPNQTEHVSQIAVDVSRQVLCFFFFLLNTNHCLDWWISSQSHLFHIISRSQRRPSSL